MVEKPEMVIYLVEELLSNLSHLRFANEILWIAVSSQEKGWNLIRTKAFWLINDVYSFLHLDEKFISPYNNPFMFFDVPFLDATI